MDALGNWTTLRLKKKENEARGAERSRDSDVTVLRELLHLRAIDHLGEAATLHLSLPWSSDLNVLSVSRCNSRLCQTAGGLHANTRAITSGNRYPRLLRPQR